MILDQFIHKKRRQDLHKDSVRHGEKPLRSFLKSLSWRVIGTIDTILVTWLVTGTLSLALSIGAVELISKMILYYFHERVWNLINWGA